MITVSIPRSILHPTLPLAELGIIANMSISGSYEYEEVVDRFFFNFNPEDIELVKRVLQRMFGNMHTQVLYG